MKAKNKNRVHVEPLEMFHSNLSQRITEQLMYLRLFGDLNDEFSEKVKAQLNQDWVEARNLGMVEEVGAEVTFSVSNPYGLKQKRRLRRGGATRSGRKMLGQ